MHNLRDVHAAALALLRPIDPQGIPSRCFMPDLSAAPPTVPLQASPVRPQQRAVAPVAARAAVQAARPIAVVHPVATTSVAVVRPAAAAAASMRVVQPGGAGYAQQWLHAQSHLQQMQGRAPAGASIAPGAAPQPLRPPAPAAAAAAWPHAATWAQATSAAAPAVARAAPAAVHPETVEIE